MKESRVIFNAEGLKKELYEKLVNVQTNNLIEYAIKSVQEIGNTISRNRMDDKGNLLDSLCWGVAYKGKLIACGFYRNKAAKDPSYLHEWFSATTRSKEDPYDKHEEIPWESLPDSPEPIVGHALAVDYISKHGADKSDNGWRVWFAICAPYWGFWEKGFTMRHWNGTRSFERFSVMSNFYDKVSRDLKPATTKIHFTNVSYTASSLAKKEKRNIGRKWK